MTKKICKKCIVKEEISLYYIWPTQWYHGAGPTIFLCDYCTKKLDRDFPLSYVLTTKECEKRIEDFLANLQKN